MNENELVAAIMPQAIEVFTAPQGLDPYLLRIRQEIDQFEPDVSTAKGRAEIASIAHKIARMKTSLDGLGKELVADLKDKPRKIDAERKRMRDTLDQWKAEVRQPLTEFERAEEARVAAHQEKIAAMAAMADIPDDARISSSDIQARITSLEDVVIGPDFEEFETPAARQRQSSINALKAALLDAREREAAEAEAERARKDAEEAARKEREDRIRKEAADAARKAAEMHAQQEREKIERERQAEREAADARERARLAEIDREKREAAEAEAKRLREADRRARDVEHRRQINAAARDALVAAGVPTDHAESAIRAIAAGDVPAVSITY